MHARRLVRIATGMHVRRWGEIALICIRHSQKPRASIILILLLTSTAVSFEMNFICRAVWSFHWNCVTFVVFLLFESTWRIAAWFKALYSLIFFSRTAGNTCVVFRPLSKRLPVSSPYHDWQKRVWVCFFPSFFFFIIFKRAWTVLKTTLGKLQRDEAVECICLWTLSPCSWRERSVLKLIFRGLGCLYYQKYCVFFHHSSKHQSQFRLLTLAEMCASFFLFLFFFFSTDFYACLNCFKDNIRETPETSCGKHMFMNFLGHMETVLNWTELLGDLVPSLHVLL